MEKADRLSKRLDWKVDIEKDNDNQIFIKDCWLCSLHEIIIKESKVDILKKIKKARDKDKDVKIAESRLSFFYFLSHFYFLVNLFLFFHF